jgi:hypothetical protein
MSLHRILALRAVFLCIASLLPTGMLAADAAALPPLPTLREELRPIRVETVDARFFELLDLGKPGLETVRRLVGEKQYGKALNAWRDYVVRKQRKRPSGEFGWHHNRLNPSFMKSFNVVLGRAKDAKEPEDTANIDGPPGQGRKINWQDPNARFRNCCPGSRTMNSMVAQYQHTRDLDFLNKWFEIVDDFCVNQKLDEEKLPIEERTGKLSYPRCRNGNGVIIQWYAKNHQLNLNAAGRIQNLAKSIGYFAKALPDGREPRDWRSESMLPIDTELTQDALDLIPADSLANIALSLYFDHAPFLLEVYGKPGRTPNQRFSGLTGMALAAYTFDEFRASAPLMQISGACLENYAATTVLPDGGDQEQSLNYNRNFIKEIQELLHIYPEGPARPHWVTIVQEAMLKRERLFAAITSPLGHTPRIGTNGGGAPPEAIWRSKELREKWRARIAKEKDGDIDDDPVARQIYACLFGEDNTKPPTFTSSAFPYSGYYVMRDGWDMISSYLWLMGSRKGSGHHKENINSLTVTAYGRNLITDAGPPPYTPTHLPESQRSEFEDVLGYFGEKSSYSSNTVLVDMECQRRCRIRGGSQAYTTPIVSRWHTSELIDLAESRYEDGYGGGAWLSPASIKSKHYRQVVFLRTEKLWLVIDRLVGDGESHEYQQQWHFPPPHGKWGIQSPGFTPEQVVSDTARRTIHTADPTGPNISLHHFSAEPIAYKRYFGQKKPRWIGWYTMDIGGERLPAVDIHACWKTDADSIVTTVLAPSPNATDIVVESTDLSRREDGVSGCRLRLASGAEVTWLAAQKQGTLQIDGLTATGEALLLVKPSGATPHGIGLGVQSIDLDKVAPASNPTDFEFKIEDGKIRVTSPIRYPETPDELTVRPDHGLFTQPVTLEIGLPIRPGAEVRFTRDGSEPTAESEIFDGKLVVNRSCELILMPFRDGKPSGKMLKQRFEIRPLPDQPPMPTVRLDTLAPVSVSVDAFALERNKPCYGSNPLSLQGKTYEHGISAHANAEVVYDVKPEYRRFVATVGIDDVAGENGNVTFQVYADGKQIAETPLLEGCTQRFWHIDCPLPKGTKQLRLTAKVGPYGGGWHMADWVNAGFVTKE